jgi:hypothetical protein
LNVITLVAGLHSGPAIAAMELGTAGSQFTLNRRPVFLMGMSYYGALGAPEATLRTDLAEIRRRGFNWIRVWATWAAFENDVSAVDVDGSPRPPYLARLKALVEACEQLGLVVDVTLSRGNGATGPARLQTLAAHRRAVETIVGALQSRRNWYLDLANERNVRDRRFASIADLKDLRELVRQLDAGRLVTASHAGDLEPADLRAYLQEVRVDFLAPHRPREPGSPGQTEAKAGEYLGGMRALGRVVPLHYQEPFRRGYSTWQPAAADFLADARGARAGAAAGWCFHTGDERSRPDGRPRRCFDLRDGSLFLQLDREERSAVDQVAALLSPAGSASGCEHPQITLYRDQS